MRKFVGIGHCHPDHTGQLGALTNATLLIGAIERTKQIHKNLKATVIIQHDPRDIDKLPAFPTAAR